MTFLRKYSYLFLTFLILSPNWIFAQKIYYVGIPSSRINYVTAAQEKAQWCWAASIQMVLNYYNIDITQKQIVERTYGRNNFGEIPDWAASIETIHLNLNNWSIDNRGRKYIVNSEFGLGAPEPFFMIEELSQHRPVIIGYNSNFGGHTVVITALSYYETQMGPIIRSIIVRDPLPGMSCDTRSNGRVEYEASTLAKRITAYWFVRVFNAGF